MINWIFADGWHIGECKDVMMNYLACIKKVKGTNEAECRNIAKSYLTCRMDRFVVVVFMRTWRVFANEFA